MSITTTLDSGIDGTLAGTKSWRKAPSSTPAAPAVTTYFYRTTGGARGSTTSVGAIPAGAIVERVVTA